jgi:hypothetical protein
MLLADRDYDADWIRGDCPPAESMGKHPSETKSQTPDLLQPVSLSRTEPDRTVLQQDQAMSSVRDPIQRSMAFFKHHLWLRAGMP